MFGSGIAELRDAMGRYAAGFDPAEVTAHDAASVVEHAAAIEKMAATVKALAAARVADSGLWRAGGDRSAAHQLARLTGSTVGQAAGAIDTARRLQELPATAAAARRGELSPQQAAAVAEAAVADPAAESHLLARAATASLNELRDDCARTKAAALPDPEARRRRIHAQRCLRTFTDAEGAWHLQLRDNPEVGARIMAALTPVRDRLFRAARAEGRRERLEAYAADALAELAAGAGDPGGRAGGSAGAKIIVRVDLDALLRGYPTTGEVAELVGYGPVAVSAIHDLIDTGDPFLAAIATRGTDIAGVVHLGRAPTALQQTALEWLYPTCAVEGCGAVGHLQRDHRLDWAKSRVTVLELLDRLCAHHHDLKTFDGWALVEGTGKRAFVAPDDPRHPLRARPPTDERATGPPDAA